jgi:uncharacterized protein (TIGR01777 family)
MKILISGATGLIGKELTMFLAARGHVCSALTRQKSSLPDQVYWDPARGDLEQHKLPGFEAVVHLAGESIVGRWSEDKKQRIRASRVDGTKMLCESLARLDTPPKVLVSASAIGYYGNRGDEELTETSAPGQMFLSEVCQAWESACMPAVQKGIRVVNLRFGVVLSARGGALAKMLPPFRMALGGKIGTGKQYMSWLTVDEAAAVIDHALNKHSLSGPVNAVSPNPVTNLEFTKTLGKVLHRFTIFPMPAFAARLAFGKMADELLLASARVLPRKLQESGYQFQHPNLEEAFRHVLGKHNSAAPQKAA